MQHYPSQEARALLKLHRGFIANVRTSDRFFFCFYFVFFICCFCLRLFPYSSRTVLNSVVDPELFSQDPDPTFQVVPDPSLGKFEVYIMGLLKDFKAF
jgi:hypothetical protein